MLIERVKHYTSELMQLGLHRQRRVLNTDEGVINFSSNDYLSLTSDPRIKKAYQIGFERYPAGSRGSMVVCGYHPIHKALEKAFAEALGVDDCILFSSGYAANLSVLGLLGHFDAHVLIDKMVHASIYDGLQLSGLSYSRFLHNDLHDLSLKINQAPHHTVIMTEGTFSMSGQCAPLAKMAQLSQPYQHELLVDEAHAFGILGPQGLGSVIQHHLTQTEVPLRIIPFGKAYAAFGAIVAGNGAWIDALQQASRPHIYSTALSPAVAYGLLETFEIVRASDDQRTKLAELVSYFRSAIDKSSLQWGDSSSPIQQLQLGCPHSALSYAERLAGQSIICLPMRQPTVSKQETGLRIILNHHHQPEDIDHLFRCLHS